MSDDSTRNDAGAPDEPRPPTREEQAVDGTGNPDESMGAYGWLLVAIVVLSFVVIPATILVNPPAIPFEVAFLVLPLLPAVLLGATAVWVALQRRRE